MANDYRPDSDNPGLIAQYDDRLRQVEEMRSPPPAPTTDPNRPLGPLLQDYLPSVRDVADKAIGNPILRNAFGMDAPASSPVITAQASTPRAGPAAPTARDSAPGSSNPPESVTSTYTPAPTVRESRGSVNTVQGNPNAARELEAINARLGLRDAANEQDRRNGMTDSYNMALRQQTSYDAATAANEARIANFRAKNGADMILAPENRGYAGQRAAIVADAASATKRAEGLRDASMAPLVPTGDILKDAIAGSDAATRAQNSQVSREQGVIGSEIAKQNLEQQKRLNQLGSILTTAAPGSAEHAKASQAMLSILGKDRPDQYKLHVVQRPDRVAADGFTVLRGGQDLVMVGPNGRPEVVPLGGSPQQQGQAKQGPQSIKDYITKMRADPRNGQFSDEQLTAEYNKRYGGAR